MSSPVPHVPPRLDKLLATADPDVLQLIERGLQGRLEPEQFEQFIAELNKLVFDEEWPDVQMDEFLFGKRYLGLPRSTIFPAVLDVLIEADKADVREIYACIGRGGGKTTFTCGVLSKATYRVFRHYRDPSSYFGVIPGTPIGIINMSPSAEQAENVMFNRLGQLFSRARCFQNPDGTAAFRKVKRHIEFPRNIHIQSGHSNHAAYVGYDVYAAAVDEMSKFPYTKADRKGGVGSVADDVYQAMKGSCLSRFPDEYKIICISSPEAKDDPLYSRVDNVLRNGVPIAKRNRSVTVDIDGDAYAKVH